VIQLADEEQARAPVPVVVAALLFPLATAIRSVQMLTGPTPKLSASGNALFALGLFALSLALAYGLRRRVWHARGAVVCFAAFNISYAVMGAYDAGAGPLLQALGYAAVIGLLLVPVSSRKWFAIGATG
jgi:hypothetical protein